MVVIKDVTLYMCCSLCFVFIGWSSCKCTEPHLKVLVPSPSGTISINSKWYFVLMMKKSCWQLKLICNLCHNINNNIYIKQKKRVELNGSLVLPIPEAEKFCICKCQFVLPQRLCTTSSSNILYIEPLLINYPPGKFNQEVDWEMKLGAGHSESSVAMLTGWTC